jgi:hypothetical protein
VPVTNAIAGIDLAAVAPLAAAVKDGGREVVRPGAGRARGVYLDRGDSLTGGPDAVAVFAGDPAAAGFAAGLGTVGEVVDDLTARVDVLVPCQNSRTL